MDLSNRFSSNGNGHGEDVLAALGISPPPTPTPTPPKPAGESASLRSEAGETSIPTDATPDSSSRTLNEDSGRDDKGRFTKGNKGGPGNPYNRRIAEFKRRFQNAITDEIMDECIAQFIALARKGDKFGLRMIAEHHLDKRVKPDQMNIEENDIIQKEAGIFSQMTGVLTKPEPSLPLMMMREARAASTEKVGHMMVNLLNCPQERIPEMQSVLQNDPRTARDWLDNGVPQGKKKETRRERKQKAQRRKRTT